MSQTQSAPKQLNLKSLALGSPKTHRLWGGVEADLKVCGCPTQKKPTLESRAVYPSGSKIAGIDEAGRGPLAGPVVAAICILPDDCSIVGLDDSKKLSEEERIRLDQEIRAYLGVQFAVGLATPQEIDQYNILKATFLAMSRALAALSTPPDLLLVDGKLAPSFAIRTIAIVKGDALCPCISAASILAKVARDQIMKKLHPQYPQYNFAINKGYGTPEHLAAIQTYGPSIVHRKSFEPISSFFRDTQLDLLS